MFPPLKPTHLYIEIVKRPNDTRCSCNQSYSAIRDSVEHGMPIEGVYLVKESETAAPYRVGGMSGRITGAAVNSVTEDIIFNVATISTNSGGTGTLQNLIYYMGRDNVIDRVPSP